MKEITKKISGDRVIWVMVILLAAFSILAVYSSTGSLAYKKQNGNTELIFSNIEAFYWLGSF